VFAAGDPAKYLVPDEGLRAFMGHCSKRIGESYFRTPRTTITAFLDFLSVLEQNQHADWRQLLGGIQVVKDEGPNTGEIVDAAEGSASGDDLATVRL
jgi:hypothetical protein